MLEIICFREPGKQQTVAVAFASVAITRRRLLQRKITVALDFQVLSHNISFVHEILILRATTNTIYLKCYLDQEFDNDGR